MTLRFVGLKVLGALATLLFVIVFNFFLFRVVENDPVGTLVRGRNLTEEQQDRLAEDFGVDQPLPEQFRRYIVETSQLNLGLSFETREPVWDTIKGKIWPTVFLVGTSAVLSAVIGTIIGIFAAWRRGSGFDAHVDRRHDAPVLDAGLLARPPAAGGVRRPARLVPDQRLHRSG